MHNDNESREDMRLRLLKLVLESKDAVKMVAKPYFENPNISREEMKQWSKDLQLEVAKQ